MNTKGLELIKLGELQEISSVNGLSVKEAMPIMRKFRDDHNLTDREALNAFAIAQRIFCDQD